mmetsp:Transcript_20016/g.31743  ORF Transcript_20016/g.31743 Transcript_20016/m.31743 type:complete len:233 (+) Transcript_20016:722-1420(+)
MDVAPTSIREDAKPDDIPIETSMVSRVRELALEPALEATLGSTFDSPMYDSRTDLVSCSSVSSRFLMSVLGSCAKLRICTKPSRMWSASLHHSSPSKCIVLITLISPMVCAWRLCTDKASTKSYSVRTVNLSSPKTPAAPSTAPSLVSSPGPPSPSPDSPPPTIASALSSFSLVSSLTRSPFPSGRWWTLPIECIAFGDPGDGNAEDRCVLRFDIWLGFDFGFEGGMGGFVG